MSPSASDVIDDILSLVWWVPQGSCLCFKDFWVIIWPAMYFIPWLIPCMPCYVCLEACFKVLINATSPCLVKLAEACSATKMGFLSPPCSPDGCSRSLPLCRHRCFSDHAVRDQKTDLSENWPGLKKKCLLFRQPISLAAFSECLWRGVLAKQEQRGQPGLGGGGWVSFSGRLLWKCGEVQSENV